MKTVFITGCPSGYGKATAEHFLKQGWNVVATMRNPDPAALGGPYDRLRVVRLDVTDDASIAQAVSEGIVSNVAPKDTRSNLRSPWKSKLVWSGIAVAAGLSAGCGTIQESMATEAAVLRTLDEVRDDTARLVKTKSSGPVVALALGGGGLRGYAHVGVLQAFEEAGINVEVVAGADDCDDAAFPPTCQSCLSLEESDVGFSRTSS